MGAMGTSDRPVSARLVGVLALACLATTVLWLVFLISGLATAGPLGSFELVLAHVRALGFSFYATYVNAALVTLTAMMLYGALYGFLKPAAPAWATIAVLFIPAYGAMNLVVYLSQITIVPRLLASLGTPESAAAEFLLRQVIQQWPDSAIAVVNNLAYAVLGVPSIVFGALLARSPGAFRIAGALLGLNGVACIAGFIGIIAGSAVLANGSLAGGVLFLLALVPMAWAFLRMRDTRSAAA